MLALVNREPLPEAPLTRLGGFHRKITTNSTACQTWFDQGLAMLYGFQYPGAKRCFSQAAKQDPECAMAHWGMAVAEGPTINETAVGAEASKRALEELQRALAAQHISPLESELIKAQQKRFAADGPENRDKLNADYADAMRKLWRLYQNDPDVGAMFGEAVIDQRPWNQWTKDGKPNPGTLEAITTFRKVLRLNPRHPQALHMLIHALEASPRPEEALQAADTLFDLQPDLGHMQHMPCHIYNRTGQWSKSVHASEVAIAQTNVYLKSRAFDFTGPSFGHYEHALAYAASMEGRSEVARRALNLDGLTPEWIEKNGSDYDQDLSLPLKVMQRFGKWEEILALHPLGSKTPFTNAMLAGARVVALAATNRIPEAKLEQQTFEKLCQLVPATSKWNDYDSALDVLNIERHLLNGEILVKEAGRGDDALHELRLAVKAEDALHYNEPPSWIQPTRHVLGAALLKLGRFRDAEGVYREDIRKNRPSGWSLYGLTKALEGQNRLKEAERTRQQFRESWKNADIQIDSSCLCLPAK